MQSIEVLTKKNVSNATEISNLTLIMRLHELFINYFSQHLDITVISLLLVIGVISEGDTIIIDDLLN